MTNVPEEIKQLAHWWAKQIGDKAGAAVTAEVLLKFETELARGLAENAGPQFLLSIGYRDVIPDVLLRAARKSNLGAIKPYLQTCTFTRAQPGEVLVQIGDRASCRDIFQS